MNTRILLSFARKGAFFAFIALVATSSFAEEQDNRPTDETLEVLGRISDLSESDPQAAIDLALKTERSVEAGTIDDAYLKLSRIQILLGNERSAECIEPLEAVIAYKILDPSTQERTARGLGQVYYQLDRQADVVALFRSVFRETDDLEPSTLQLYAVALLDTGKADEAVRRCEQALGLRAELDSNLCQIAAAALQSAERFAASARYIELLLLKKPNDAPLWDQLASAYYQAGDLESVYGAIERARERGFKQDPESELTLVEILYETERYTAAADRIETWIDSDPSAAEERMWRLLIYCYDQQGLDEKKLAVLKRASRLTDWPDIELQLADHYWQNEDYRSVYAAIQRALSKGPVPNPGDAWTLAAASALALEDVERAEVSLDAARRHQADPQSLERLERSLAALRERLDDASFASQ